MIEKKKAYERKIFVSKSFGNVVSNAARDKYEIEADKYVYLSPLPEALSGIEKYPGMIVTSDHDEYVDQKGMDKILTFKEHETLVFKDGDHSLECDDTNKTIDFCKTLISQVIKFVNNEPMDSLAKFESVD